MKLALALVAALMLALPAGPVAAQDGDCEVARCNPDIQQALSQCPCPEASNHGRYVSCIARAVNTLAKNGAIPNNCRGRIKRCAAKSICGKPGFVTCQIPTEFGVCGTPCAADPGLTCCADATTACTADTDCVLATKCKITSSEERCLAKGGQVGASSTCCADCAG